jgi:hypothetical protein
VRKSMLGRMLVVLFAVTACSRATTIETPSTGVRPTGPRPALEAFLAAVRAQDLQAMAGAWGDKDGSVRDSNKIPREDVERRELIMMCYFRHDRYRVLGEQPATGGERVMQVELTKGTLSRTTNFFLVNAGDRWYVRTADLEPVKDLCAQRKG